MKTFLTVLILLAIGGGMAWFGYTQTQTQEITCDGAVMSPGDICEYSDGTRNGYDEEPASQQGSGWIGIGMGGVVAAFGAVALVSAAVRRGRPAASG